MSTVPALKTFSMPKGQELTDLTNFCKVMADSPAYRKLGPGGVMSIVLTAKELNLPMMPCLNGGMYNFSGTVSLSAQLMQAMLMRGGVNVKVIQLNDSICKLEFTRNGKENFQFAYTVDDARKAHYLGKDNWKNHLRDMLYCRALSGGARKYAPDILLGCYVHGELNGQDVPYEMVNVPEEACENVEEIPEQKPQEQIEFQKVEGFDQFVKDNDLLGKSDRAKYVEEITKASANKTKDEIINFAVQNPERFESAFQKWLGANKKTDSSKKKVEPPQEETPQ